MLKVSDMVDITGFLSVIHFFFFRRATFVATQLVLLKERRCSRHPDPAVIFRLTHWPPIMVVLKQCNSEDVLLLDE